jgi:hypothetical protein
VVKLNVIYDEFNNYDDAHHKLKALFAGFQNNIFKLEETDFQVKGVSVETINANISRLEYIGRHYEFRFSTVRDDDTLMGKMSVFKETIEGNFRELGYVTFDTDATVNVPSPDSDIKRVSMDNTFCCCALVLNFIRDDIND